MYYIYHIPGKKIGCSKNPKQRVKKQGYSEFEILGQYQDINIASDMEQKFQIEYGYKTDNTKYSQTISAPTKEGMKKGGQNGVLKKFVEENPDHLIMIQSLGGKVRGPIQGKINKENGHMSKLGKQMTEYNNRIQICPYCKKETRGIGYTRWHGENCKYK